MAGPESLIGRTIAQRYCLEQVVGGGAMGHVYRAKHVGLGIDVAIKIMRPAIAGEAAFKERFYREAKAASVLAHPSSVRVLDYGQEDDGLVYLAMEFLRGRDLLEVLNSEWPLSDERIVDILVQALAAVGAAHGHGIIHRDLKPENIMIVPDEDDAHRDRVKVCDFGIAKVTDGRAFKSAENVKTSLTTGNAIIGTPEYMSPEQAEGKLLDARSDLYALGVVLYRMLTRRLPFEAENSIGIAIKHIIEEPVPPSRIAPKVNARLEAICMRAMQKDPRARFASAKDMRGELRAALGYSAPSSSGPGWLVTPPPAPSSVPSMPSVSSDASHSPLATAPTVSGGLVARQMPLAAEVEAEVPAGVPKRSSGRILGLAAACVLALVAGAALVWSSASTATPAVGLVPVPATESALPATTLLPSASSEPSNARTPPVGVKPATTTATSPRSTAAAPITPTVPPVGDHEARPVTPSLPATRQPPPPSPPTPAPPPPSPPPPATDYKPTNALVVRELLTAERVQRDVLDRKLAEIAPRLNECYRDALFMAGSPVGGRGEINMSIDPAGHVVSVVTAPQLAPFQRCASRTLSTISVPSQAVEPGGGTAIQVLKLVP